MHPKTPKLFNTVTELGFWQSGVGFKDMYGTKKDLENDEKYAKLYKYIIQTEDRLHLFEWLLARYQKDIFIRYNENQSQKSDYVDNIERFQRIKDILTDLGLFWTNKYSKGVDYSKIVEGLSGAESSFHIVYSLAKFVLESTQPIKVKEESEAFDTLCGLASNMDTLVNQKLNLFPIDFPCKYDLTYEEVQKEIQTLKAEYQERLEQFEELVLKYQEKCEGTDGEIKYASSATKQDYAKALAVFTDELGKNVEEYKLKKYKLRNMISRMESNKISFPEELVELINNINQKHVEITGSNKIMEDADLNEKITVLESNVAKLSAK